MKVFRPVALTLGLAAPPLVAFALVRSAADAEPDSNRHGARVEHETRVIVARPDDPAYRALEADGWRMCMIIGGANGDGSPAQYLFKRDKVCR
jgi:hypothetical protein